MHASQVDIERSLPAFKGDTCKGQLDDLLRICLRLHAEMAHITTNLQYYINLEVVECESCLTFCPCLSLSFKCSFDAVLGAHWGTRRRLVQFPKLLHLNLVQAPGC